MQKVSSAVSEGAQPPPLRAVRVPLTPIYSPRGAALPLTQTGYSWSCLPPSEIQSWFIAPTNQNFPKGKSAQSAILSRSQNNYLSPSWNFWCKSNSMQLHFCSLQTCSKFMNTTAVPWHTAGNSRLNVNTLKSLACRNDCLVCGFLNNIYALSFTSFSTLHWTD